MTNYNKIVKFIEAGFLVEAYDKLSKDYCVYSSINSDGTINNSDWYKDKVDCYNDTAETSDNGDGCDECDLTLTPIPQLRKEIKGKVQIIDCQEIRYIADKFIWNQNKVNMIGQVNLNIKLYHNNEGEAYNIKEKDESDWWTFPAQFVAPSFEEDKTEEMTLEEVCKELGKDIKIIK